MHTPRKSLVNVMETEGKVVDLIKKVRETYSFDDIVLLAQEEKVGHFQFKDSH